MVNYHHTKKSAKNCCVLQECKGDELHHSKAKSFEEAKNRTLK
jgi:hypothetical protein